MFILEYTGHLSAGRCYQRLPWQLICLAINEFNFLISKYSKTCVFGEDRELLSIAREPGNGRNVLCYCKKCITTNYVHSSITNSRIWSKRDECVRVGV